MLEARLEDRSFEDFKLDDVAVIICIFRAILCMRMRNYSVLQLILTFLPIIQHFQNAAYYSNNYSSIISSGLVWGHISTNS